MGEALTGDRLTPAVLAPSRGFSVDVEGPIAFQEAAEGFGQSVVQFGSASAGGLIVGAPLQMGDVNETGKIYKCNPGSIRCQEILIQRPPDAKNMSLGLSLAARGSQFLACGPTVHRACGENMYINGYCFLLDQSLRQLQRIPDSLPECRKHVTDIALLIDGSGSIKTVDFRKMKTFLSEIMKRFHNTDTQFALMQYSNKFKLHFNFMEYTRSHDPDHLVQGVEQLHGTTHTATAIRKVVQELFSSSRGARDEATKVLIVITDGEKYTDPLSYSDTVPESERAGIIRYAIGVSLAEIWSSSVVQVKQSFLVKGQVFCLSYGPCSDSDLLGLNPYPHRVRRVPVGEEGGGDYIEGMTYLPLQIGSYFGGTLCAVDLDRDGNTDLVLIGAPMYYSPLNGGRVYNCPIKGQTLQGQTGQAFGRFGASMSEIGDISGDGQTDVAIGAPMENDNRGALYIFHGEKGGLRPQYRQRIEGSLFPSRLHYFGQAVSGGTDLTRDGLPDIAVGAQGQVLLLRSRPVLRVRVSISFQPPTIPTSAFNCQEQEQLNTEASRAEVCFTITKSTKDRLGNSIFSTIQYSLALDPGRTKIRAAFDSTGAVLSRELRLGIGKRCETYQIMLPVSMGGSQLLPLPLCLPLAPKSPREQTSLRVPPSPHFPSGARCVSVSPSGQGTALRKLSPFFPLSLSTLVVGITPELNTTVSIQNHGENSYSTTVRFSYPAALSYRRVLLLQVPQCTPGLERGLGIRAPGFSSCSVLWGVCFFQVKNLRQRSVPISVTFQFPVELSGVRVWDASEVVPSKVPASPCPCVSSACPWPHPVISFRPQDCSVATCKKIRCRIASLEMKQPLEFMIKGKVSFQWVSQTQQQKVSLVSEARIEYEEKKYTQKEGFVQRQVQTVVEHSEVYNYLPIIVGSSMGGLVLLALITAALYKFGFFKRQYKQMMEDTVEGEGPGPTQSATAENPPASDAPKQ
uniref:VWFA domain-containing protein n=1 Tax=Chelydra serpentina TaxID=8475 RepID=A0A8C3SGC4_CHESE